MLTLLPYSTIIETVLPIALRSVISADESFLTELFIDVKGDEFRNAGLPASQIDQLLKMQFSAQTQTYRATFPNAEYSIIESGETAVGRMIIDRSPVGTRLVDISVLRNRRGMGIGSFCLNALKSESERIVLQVFSQNEGAIRLYQRHGFTVASGEGIYFEMEWNKK